MLVRGLLLGPKCRYRCIGSPAFHSLPPPTLCVFLASSPPLPPPHRQPFLWMFSLTLVVVPVVYRYRARHTCLCTHTHLYHTVYKPYTVLPCIELLYSDSCTAKKKALYRAAKVIKTQ